MADEAEVNDADAPAGSDASRRSSVASSLRGDDKRRTSAASSVSQQNEDQRKSSILSSARDADSRKSSIASTAKEADSRKSSIASTTKDKDEEEHTPEPEPEPEPAREPTPTNEPAVPTEKRVSIASPATDTYEYGGRREVGKRAQRATSNVFAAFPQHQIQEFKEAFTTIDQNRDGFIDIEDLKDMYASLGRTPSDKELQAMLNESPGPLNFTMFINLFGEKLSGTDPEDALRNAFAMFDSEGKGYLEEDYIKDLLEHMGDNFSQEELRQTWKEAPISGGRFDYNSFVTLLKRGKEDE